MRTALLGNRDALPPGSIAVLNSLGDEQGSKGRYAIAGSIKNLHEVGDGILMPVLTLNSTGATDEPPDRNSPLETSVNLTHGIICGRHGVL